ncbi:MAG: hypothetical protein GXP14_15775 [Gammaproteobacteria bacterium]|nr:hypothetical protein [Gammaproteobacteria bacterium]
MQVNKEVSVAVHRLDIRLERNNLEKKHSDLALVKRVALGDKKARKELTEKVHDTVHMTNNRFCKLYCLSHRYEYACTIDKAWGRPAKEAPLCEWGNASYTWMLDDLTKIERLKRFQGYGQGGLKSYIGKIVYSLPFRERWRDWRFGKRIKVPTYIRELDADAGKIFLLIRSGDELANIAQRLNRQPHEVEDIASQIVAELIRRHRLYLLDPPKTVSLSGAAEHDPFGKGDDEESYQLEKEIPSYDTPPEERDAHERIKKAWETLNAEERFVLEAMKVDGLSARAVLDSLQHFNITIKKGVAPERTTQQQVYYFFRKSWGKLTKNSGLFSQKE